MRVISICPSNTEIMAYLGKTELLAGTDDFSDWPNEIIDLPKVGPDLAVDMDKIEALKPDLILASLSVPGMERNIIELEKRGLPYLVINSNTLDGIANDIQEIGEALHFPELGHEKAQMFRNELAKYRKQVHKYKQCPTIYWEWWPKPVFTPGKMNWLTEISELAGAHNVFATENSENVQTDWRDVMERDPDHICMVWVGVKEDKMRPELVRKRPGWSVMKAVQDHHIHVMEESLYCRPSPRILEGLDKLIRLIHKQS